MIFRNKNRIAKIITGIILPVFLFSPIFVGAEPEQSQQFLPIIFGTDSLEDIQESYGIAEVRKVFPNSSNLELAKSFKGLIPQEDFVSLLADSRVTYAERDFSVRTSIIIPDDQYFTSDPTDEDKQWYLPKVKMPAAWGFTTGRNAVTVAVIDTGIHASHVELNDGRIIGGYNTMTDEIIPGNSNSDVNGHGTAVAGIIGAISNNSRGIAGVNWNVKIMPLKALEAAGTGAISDVAEAIVWAVDHGANIINLSLGGPGFGADKTLNDAITYAYERDVLIVSAAGNDLAENGINLDTSPVYPICSDGGRNMVLGVAASDVNDRKASFSNFGINCVDITAPGKKILTTAFLPSDPSNAVLIYGSGTSLATPIVAGVAALLKSKNFDLTNAQIRDIILGTAVNIDALNQNNCLGSSCNGFLGKGRLNAQAALSPQPIIEGSLIREVSTGKIYRINANTKRYVSQFVFTQRGYNLAQVVNEYENQLASVVEGEAITPLEGTLIKAANNPTVYVIHQQQRRPLTFLVFNSRNFSFVNVKTMPAADVEAIKLGEWYWPPDGTMVLVKGDPTVYVMDREVRRPVTFFVFQQRKLSFAKVVTVTQDEFSHVPKAPDAYWLPPKDGTLVKSSTNPTVYLIENESKRPISGTAFASRKLSFSNIVTLPQAEIDVILPGSPILN